jgi:hypothetical protein
MIVVDIMTVGAGVVAEATQVLPVQVPLPVQALLPVVVVVGEVVAAAVAAIKTRNDW